MVNVAVLGAGSWGTTLAKVFADGGNPVSLWARREELARAIQNTRENPEYLPGIELPAAIQATSNAAEALENAAIAVFGVPSQTMRMLSPIHISEPTRPRLISYPVFCLKKKIHISEPTEFLYY